MTMNKNKESISFEEALQMPELAHLHDTMRYLENAPDSDIMPQKYEMGLEYIATKKTRLLFNESPDLPLKSVVSIVLEQLPNDISASILLKITQFIVLKWRRLAEAVYEKDKGALLV